MCRFFKAVRARCFAQSGERVRVSNGTPLENSHKTLNGSFCCGENGQTEKRQTKTKLLRSLGLIEDTVVEEEKREEENEASL